MGGSLMGGSSSSSQSGYSALSPALKKAFDPFGAAINYFTLPQFGAANTVIPGQTNTYPKAGRNGKNGPVVDQNGMPVDTTMGGRAGVTDMFTPLAQTADETRAMEMMRQGFAPTEASLRSDINMQMNPYMDSVIGGLNRQAAGEYSILKQGMSEAGQSGSNRSLLGANDIENTRQMGIGQLLATQYNNSLNNATNVLPGLRSADAMSLMGIGEFQRSMDTQRKQAPITALQTGTSLMSPFISGNGHSTSQTTNGILPMMMQAASIYKQPSDPRLKKEIKYLGQENGHNVYEFKYKEGEQKYIGVMADEIQETNPEAVTEIGGYLAVDYSKIGVNFRAVE